jgi:4-hydroxy-tetrahydrodipicolinate synthase
MFKGVGTALITPFDEEGKVDFNSLRQLVDFQLKGGVDALIVLGTTGESPVIQTEEKEQIISQVISWVNHKIPVIVGTGANDPVKVVQNNEQAERLGADGLLIVNPYYNKSTQNGLVTYYQWIAEKAHLPIILYNVPGRTGMNMMPDTILNIHRETKHIVAVKEACGSISQIAELMAKKPPTLSVLSGNDDQTLPIMALGGDGVISVASNVIPAVYKQLTSLLLKDQMMEARAINHKYLRLANLLFVETNPIPVKYAVSKLGLCKNIVRLPLVPTTPSTEKLIDQEMAMLGIY